MNVVDLDRVNKAMYLLRSGLAPFVQCKVMATEAGIERVETLRCENPKLAEHIDTWDVAMLLKLMGVTWNDVFRSTFGFYERSLVSELQHWRNEWAHQKPFSSDDAYRALDSAERLLTAISAPEASEVAKIKRKLRRLELFKSIPKKYRKGKKYKEWKKLKKKVNNY